MRTIFCALAVVLSLVCPAAATMQRPDVIIHKGRFYVLGTPVPNKDLPLEVLWKDEKDRPKLTEGPGRMMSTALWRGYIAHWELVDGTLYLKALDAWQGDERADLKKLFGTRYVEGKGVKADWFSGPLVMDTRPFAKNGERVTLQLDKGDVVPAEGAGERTPTIEELQEEFRKRLLAEAAKLPGEETADAIVKLAAKISRDVYGRHPQVLMSTARKQLDALPAFDVKQLDHCEVKLRLDVGLVLHAGGLQLEDLHCLYGWRAWGVSTWVKNMVMMRAEGLQQLARRAVLGAFVPDKLYLLRVEEKLTLALNSLDDWFLIEVELTPEGIFRPKAVTWYVPRRPAKGPAGDKKSREP